MTSKKVTRFFEALFLPGDEVRAFSSLAAEKAVLWSDLAAVDHEEYRHLFCESI